MTTTSINQANQAEIITGTQAILDGQVDGGNDGNPLKVQAKNEGKSESELRAAARRHGLTLKELASLMGVNKGHLCSVANGHRPWTPYLREKVLAVLGEVPGQGIVYRPGGAVTSESSYIRDGPGRRG